MNRRVFFGAVAAVAAVGVSEPIVVPYQKGMNQSFKYFNDYILVHHATPDFSRSVTAPSGETVAWPDGLPIPHGWRRVDE